MVPSDATTLQLGAAHDAMKATMDSFSRDLFNHFTPGIYGMYMNCMSKANRRADLKVCKLN